MEEELVLTRELLETRAGLTTLVLTVTEGLKYNDQVLVFIDPQGSVRVLSSEFVLNLLALPEEQGLSALNSLGTPREKLIEYIRVREEFHKEE